MDGIRAIFFDLGGTLFSNRQIPVACMPVLEEAARRLGIDGGIAGIGSAFVDASRLTNESYVNRPYYLHRDLFLDTAARLLEVLGLEASEEFNEWFYEAQRTVLIRQMLLREDCLETLDALRSRGFQLLLVSNIDDDLLDPMLDNLGLRPYFDHWISSEAARSCKPDAGIFRQALERAGCGPEEVIFVGDSRVHDIQGARAVGIRSVLISEEGGVSHFDDENFLAEPDHVIRALSEVKEIVGARSGGDR
ncbi:MAG: HAD family hydrolase [Deltaproteobacteria bacterium]|nr:HAD family hydrolase [Deltaproteobacteria bacterium]